MKNLDMTILGREGRGWDGMRLVIMGVGGMRRGLVSDPTSSSSSRCLNSRTQHVSSISESIS